MWMMVLGFLQLILISGGEPDLPGKIPESSAEWAGGSR
jgi:hypothetical protein